MVHSWIAYLPSRTLAREEAPNIFYSLRLVRPALTATALSGAIYTYPPGTTAGDKTNREMNFLAWFKIVLQRPKQACTVTTAAKGEMKG